MKFDLVRKISEGLKGYKRVLKIAHKPDKEEYETLIKIVGLGIVIIGLLGILINLGFSYSGFF